MSGGDSGREGGGGQNFLRQPLQIAAKNCNRALYRTCLIFIHIRAGVHSAHVVGRSPTIAVSPFRQNVMVGLQVKIIHSLMVAHVQGGLSPRPLYLGGGGGEQVGMSETT